MKKVSTYHANGREDFTLFDEKGRVIEETKAAYTPWQNSTRFGYYSGNSRLSIMIDAQGKWTRYIYNHLKDDRIANFYTISTDGAERQTTAFQYSTTFPDFVKQKTDTVTAGGNSATRNITYDHPASAPLITKRNKRWY